MFDTITTFVHDLAARWSTYLSGVVLLSVFSMAILQTAKDLLPIRRIFHQRFLRQWFMQKCADKSTVEAVENDLVALATDGDTNAFYDLAIEQLCGQISAAAQIALEYPAEHKQLLRCMTAKSPGPAVDRLTSQERPLSQAFESLKAQGGQANEQLQALADAKARVMHQLQRSIDGLQIAATYRWKFGFQVASFTLSAVIAFVATASTSWPVATRVFVAFAAGFLAPVARDLQAKLQQVK